MNIKQEQTNCILKKRVKFFSNAFHELDSVSAGNDTASFTRQKFGCIKYFGSLAAYMPASIIALQY